MRDPRWSWAARAALALIGAAVCTGARAQLSGSVTLASDQRFRGTSLSHSKPALRVSLNQDSPSGWYAGASASRVESVEGDRYAQVVPYAGLVVRAGPTGHLDVGITYAHFGGGGGAENYGEAYVGWLAERWDARIFYAPDYYGRGVRTLYAEMNTHAALGTAARTFAHAGVLQPLAGSGATSGRARFDCRVGAGVSVGDVDWQLFWDGSTVGGPDQSLYRGRRSTIAASATFFF